MKRIIFTLRRFCRSLLGLRNLKMTTKVESKEELRLQYGMNSEEEIIKAMAQEISNDRFV